MEVDSIAVAPATMMAPNLFPPPTWAGTIEGHSEPALLVRVLENLTQGGAVIDRLRYDADVNSGQVRIEVLFLVDDFEAHRVAAAWREEPGVSHVSLCPATIHRRSGISSRLQRAAGNSCIP